MKTLILIVSLFITFCVCNDYKKLNIKQITLTEYELVSRDSIGFVVTYKEKCGNLINDSCTIILQNKDSYVLIRRDLTKKIIIKSNINTITWRLKENEF